MSKFTLRRVKTKDEEYRQIKENVVSHFVASGEFTIDTAIIDRLSEPVIYNGIDIVLELDDSLLDKIVFSNEEKYNNKYQREADLAIYLSSIFKLYPQNLIFDANVWTYMNLTVLNKYVNAMYLSGKIKNPEDRIKRCLFNEVSHSKIDRSGMRFLWYFGTKLAFYENEERAVTALEFIDPVKAIFERKMSCNNMITMAFVDAIIKGGKNNSMKNNEMRKSVPHHIQCYAGVINMDAFEYNELVNIMVAEQNRIMGKK